MNEALNVVAGLAVGIGFPALLALTGFSILELHWNLSQAFDESGNWLYVLGKVHSEQELTPYQQFHYERARRWAALLLLCLIVWLAVYIVARGLHRALV